MAMTKRIAKFRHKAEKVAFEREGREGSDGIDFRWERVLFAKLTFGVIGGTS
jgi:hypothetical protein